MKSHLSSFAFLISKDYLYCLVYCPDRFIFICECFDHAAFNFPLFYAATYFFLIAAILYYLLEVVPARLPLLNVQISCP